MFEELKDKTVFITGGAGGIGSATARLLGSVGMRPFITDITDELVLEAIDRLAGQGVTAFGCACNTADSSSVDLAAAKCKEQCGIPYALVNCAGIYRDRLFSEMQESEWKETIDINLNGVYNCIKAVSALMLEAGGGSIVSLTSRAGIAGSVLHAHYAASKAGIIGLTTSLAREFAEKGIRVNCIAPGIINTKMVEAGARERGDMWLANIPMRRFGTVEEAANVILFLVSDMSSYMTGQTLNVTGGWEMHS